MLDFSLDELLNSYREAANTEREKGTYFERLVRSYLLTDPAQCELYSDVWDYYSWAQENGWPGKDIGIDLVAKLRDGDGYAAIQCKFYSEQKVIQASDVAGFLAASGKDPFNLRVFVDTTETDWSENAVELVREQTIPVLRISLEDLRESAVDWSTFQSKSGDVDLRPKKELRPHQEEALKSVEDGFQTSDRGKLLMACGTGKTFTALKIAEHIAGKGKRVLFLVPSLALIAQTVREWTADSKTPLRSFAVCSDVQVGKRRKNSDDIAEIEVHELAFPATTNADQIAARAGHSDPERMTVVFSTYQSIDVLTRAQEAGLPEFDLIICDEAHRTTGAKFGYTDDSNFVKIHDDANVRGKKRLYMTATPRVYGDAAKAKANDAAVELCDMNDERIYGPTFFQRGFGWAVENGLLTDYKVVVLAMDEAVVDRAAQNRLKIADNELKLDDASRIIGCYRALGKMGDEKDWSSDPAPMKRALAFCRDIRSSKMVANEFGPLVSDFNGEDPLFEDLDKDEAENLRCEVRHVDGTFNAKTRGALLHWLSEEPEKDTCRILSNARCLSEGVDVPALDAILFLHPRKSQIDVVQSVGRVMRRAPEKKLGYVILPIVIPAGVNPEDALDDNERYRVVWQILNALRSHDERLEATINKMDLGVDVSEQIEVIAVTDNLPDPKADDAGLEVGGEETADDEIEFEIDTAPKRDEEQLNFIFDELPAAIRAKIVQKCGTRTYWEKWATDIAEIARKHIVRIKTIIGSGDAERQIFDEFLEEIRDDLNDGVTEDEAIEMLAQHLITKPVFEALFEGYDFVKNNPVSQAMQTVLQVLEPKHLEKEAESLEGFYASVRRRAAGIDNDEGKQKIIVELYESFFKDAFPKLQEKLGIVYTPVEIVDFILNSVNEVLEAEFGQNLGSEGVHIIDPFTGTGTFITRLLQSGLIPKEVMERKFREEIHANEIVLLAYYIAAINIEAAYHDVMGGEYVPFEGICLTDTFQMYEGQDDMIAQLLPDNSERRQRQKDLDIKVIVGNPPYSAKQKSANDNAANVPYANLDSRIETTYAKSSAATNKNDLYNSYIRAFRWASDRIGSEGILAFVTGAGWLSKPFADGMRKHLRNDFSKLYVINLRGDIRRDMLSKGAAGEGGNVFAQGSTTGISIAIFVRKRDETDSQIFYHDIGLNLSTSEKLEALRSNGSLQGLSASGGFEQVEPSQKGYWIEKGDETYGRFMPLGDKKKPPSPAIFANYSLGVASGRDAWCYNFSGAQLEEQVSSLIEFYNDEVARYEVSGGTVEPQDFVQIDLGKMSWNRNALTDLSKGKRYDIGDGEIVPALYRPFVRSNLYFSRQLNAMLYQNLRIFPERGADNRVISVTGVGPRSGTFSVIMSNLVTDLQCMDNGQCFPLVVYEPRNGSDDLFADASNTLEQRDGLTDAGLRHFQAAYPNESISKDDIFYYVYGLLHSEDYRSRFADNLTKELPRIPCVKKVGDFWAFSKAGRELGDLHVNYETVEPYEVKIEQGDLRLPHVDDEASYFRVEKMKFAGKRPNLDKTKVIYNSNITMADIPLEAYDYVVNGKPALEWVMERQAVKTDKKSGIVNDANDYANETMENPRYPLELFQRVITVSLRTMEIVRSLPALDID
ncbi:type ISP restriction/modification enzyme [Ruegeria sp. HKCCA5763]|uniref:DEAD/DEAH box helicase n=1 Tax=Ruegeria sp. HKCCA5763 TaxID=2682987 RepID=UPI001489B472|nr:type ISP restriction/modification enzyme [Ruegeria sp. HKCCA5763]